MDFIGKALLATAMAATFVFCIRAQSQTDAQDRLLSTWHPGSLSPTASD
jgi:hypothetical protein